MIILDTKLLIENENIFQHVESRLRISLPENLSTALADGVILCHVANHVRPRAVPSIHVPSPAVVSNFSKSISIPIDLRWIYICAYLHDEIILFHNHMIISAQAKYSEMSKKRGKFPTCM